MKDTPFLSGAKHKWAKTFHKPCLKYLLINNLIVDKVITSSSINILSIQITSSNHNTAIVTTCNSILTIDYRLVQLISHEFEK